MQKKKIPGRLNALEGIDAKDGRIHVQSGGGL
jgi:hypothetical protein